MKGQLSRHPLAELIREISAAHLSGALRLRHERVKALVYFEAGEVAGARSNLRQHRLGECLRRWGAVAHERLDKILTESMTDEEAASALVSSGALTQESLPKLRARQCEDVLRPLLLLTEGEWAFDARARLDAGVTSKPDVSALLLEGARRLPKEFAAARVWDEGETIAPAPAGLPEGAQLLPAEAFVLSRVDAPLRVGELLALSGLPEQEARQAVYALALGGLLSREVWPRAFKPQEVEQLRKATGAAAVSPTVAPQSPVEEKEAEEETPEDSAADPREEVKALLALAEAATHYEVLGVGRRATPAEIKRAYYALAKRFHPDRFRRIAGVGTGTRIDNAFARISQAYETLKDPTQRAGYDLKLTERERAAARSAPTVRKPAEETGRPPQYRAEDSFRQGLDAMEHGNRLQAVLNFAEAVRLAPRDPRYRAHYGRALAGDASTRRQAEAELKAAIALDEGNVSYRVMLAQVYRDLGMRLRAEGELQRALSVEPNHAEARRLLDALQRS